MESLQVPSSTSYRYHARVLFEHAYKGSCNLNIWLLLSQDRKRSPCHHMGQGPALWSLFSLMREKSQPNTLSSGLRRGWQLRVSFQCGKKNNYAMKGIAKWRKENICIFLQIKMLLRFHICCLHFLYLNCIQLFLRLEVGNHTSYHLLDEMQTPSVLICVVLVSECDSLFLSILHLLVNIALNIGPICCP